MKETETRQAALKELLKNEQISDQKQLVQLLKERFGIQTNQAVVSRDLRRFGVTKKEMIYQLPVFDVTTELLKLAVVAIEYNEVMCVITTHPALAAFVGDCLDQHTDLDILGCLAGENAVFVTPRSIKNIKATYQAICKKLHFKGKKDE